MHMEMIVNTDIFDRFEEVSKYDSLPSRCKCKDPVLKWGVLRYTNGAEDWIAFCVKCNYSGHATNDKEDFDRNFFSRRYLDVWYNIQWPVRRLLEYTRDLKIVDILAVLYREFKTINYIYPEEDKWILNFANVLYNVGSYGEFAKFCTRVNDVLNTIGYKTELKEDSIKTETSGFSHDSWRTVRHRVDFYLTEKIEDSINYGNREIQRMKDGEYR